MRRLRTLLTLAVLLGAASGAAGVWAYAYSDTPIDRASLAPEWREAAWPLPADQWGSGKFFHCDKDRCGTAVDLYVRAKVGFCKCDIGVSDDEELDRIGDLALFAERPLPLASGQRIAVAWMKGRSRAFTLRNTLFRKTSALSVGFNDRCDAIVATAVAEGGQAAVIEPDVIKFLNGDVVMNWAKIRLGL